jgi:hypothetical protein
MKSRRLDNKELAEALAAIAVVLSFEFAAPAIALAVGTLGVGDIIAAATFASGLTQGLGFWSYVFGCGYTFYSTAVQAWHEGLAALNNEPFIMCAGVTTIIL